MLIGSARVDPEDLKWLRGLFDGVAIIHVGFGLTETNAGSSITHIGDESVDSVGIPIPGLKYGVAYNEGEKYGYEESDIGGRLLLSGPTIFKGYFEKQDATTEALIKDKDGTVWFDTKDLATIKPDGAIRIDGRDADSVKLSNGNFVNLANIEEIINNDLKTTIVIHATSSYDYAIAIVSKYVFLYVFILRNLKILLKTKVYNLYLVVIFSSVRSSYVSK